MSSHEAVGFLRQHRNNDLFVDVRGILAPVAAIDYHNKADAIVVELIDGDAMQLLRDMDDGWHTDLGHSYMSSSCLHATFDVERQNLHAYCQGTTGACGEKVPARCKFCVAPCRCACHRDPA